MDKGLWRYTRHPNYFGDACVWWGLYLIAAETGLGAWALPGPVLITFLLTKWSGVPTTEGKMKKSKAGLCGVRRADQRVRALVSEEGVKPPKPNTVIPRFMRGTHVSASSPTAHREAETAKAHRG